MPSPTTIIHTLTQFAQQQRDFAALPPDVITASKEMMVNAAAAGLAGAAQADGQTVTNFVQEMGGNGKCTIIGKGLRTSPVYAALTNGVLIHLLDFDDEIPANGSHPSSAVFPVVMALGEMNGLTGPDVLAAFAVGCEVASKLQSLPAVGPEGEPENDREVGEFGQQPATLGATLAAAMLLELDETQTLQALLLSGRPGLPPAMPALAGPLRAYGQGQAALSGITAAMLVSQGLSAVPGGYQSSNSVSPALAEREGALAEKLAESLGRPFDIVGSGMGLRLYPCASPAHTAIDAALQLVQQYRIPADDMAAIQVRVTPSALAALPYPTPANGWEARACLSYIVASALTYGQPLIDNFTDAAVADHRVRDLMDRISVAASESPLTSIPYPCSIAATLRNGRQIQHRVEFARGLAELPLSPEELDAKFLYCSRYILPPDHIEEAITRLRDLENIDNTTGLFSVLGG